MYLYSKLHQLYHYNQMRIIFICVRCSYSINIVTNWIMPFWSPVIWFFCNSFDCKYWFSMEHSREKNSVDFHLLLFNQCEIIEISTNPHSIERSWIVRGKKENKSAKKQSLQSLYISVLEFYRPVFSN